MRRVKLLLLGYLALVGLIVLAALVGVATAPAVPRDPNTYYEAYWNTIQTFDPAKAYDAVSGKMLDQCIETLYEYDGFDPNYGIVPMLAAALPEVSDDGRTVTIRLRPDVRYPATWADGTPVEPWRDTPRHVKADDVVFALERIADFHNASNLYGMVLQGKVVGAEDYRRATERRDPESWYYDELSIEGVRAIDDLTLEIRLTRPFPQLIYMLIHSSTSPMPREYYRHYAVDRPTEAARADNAIAPDEVLHNRRLMRWRMLGTGPYQLADYQRERHVEMTINPMYRGRPTVDGAPGGLGGPHPDLAPDEILPRAVTRQMHLFSRESLPRWYNFTLGAYDKIWFIPVDKFGQAVESGQVSPDYARRGMRSIRMPRPQFETCDFHLRDPVFRDNLPLRRAMSLAIDREELVRKFYNDEPYLPAGLVPPGSFTWDPDYEAPYFRYDPEEARRLAADAKRLHEERFGEPLPTITYTLRGNRAKTVATGEFLALCWKAAGIDVVVEPLDFAKWLDEKRAHNLQFWSGGWIADYPDEESFLQLYYSRNYDGGANGTGYNNPEFDALYERAAVLPDSPERRDLYRQMCRIIENDVASIVLFYDVRREMYFDWLGDIDLHVYLKAQPMYYELDGALREARLRGDVYGTLEELRERGEWPPHTDRTPVAARGIPGERGG